MLFYEELIKKIESQNLTDIKKVEKFTLNMSKKISGYGIALPLIAIGIFQAYSYTLFHKWYLLIFAIIFSFIGFKQFKNVLVPSIKRLFSSSIIFAPSSFIAIIVALISSE